MPKMVFIEPKAPNYHIFSKFTLPRLGNFILATMMKNRGWGVEVIVEEIRKINLDRISSADIVGISTITPTAPRAYAIADQIREMGIPVIIGGPHVTFLPDEALEHADFVIRGEGENALMKFIDSWEGSSDFSGVPNLSYKKDGRVIHNPVMPLVNDLDSIPFADFALLQKKILRIAGQNTIPVQTSRGCPFNCSFCSVTGMFGKKVRFRSTENIIEELRQYNHRKNVIFFYDDNFTANRARTKRLLNAMMKENFKFKWSTQVRVDIAKDEELVKMMKDAGCHTLYIGFESVNPESLKSMKKDQTVEEINHAARVLRRHKIHIHGMFVYGFDEDDWKTVKETVKFAKRAKLNSTQFLILTPLPGCKFYNEVARDNRITFTDWNLYDAHHVVFKPRRLSLFDLQKAQIFSHEKFYSWGQTFKKCFQFKLLDIGVAYYARKLNRSWKKRNIKFLKVIELLKPDRRAKITIDYRENVSF